MPAPCESALPTLRDILARVHLRLILFAVILATASLLVSGALVIRNYSQRNLDLLAHTIGYTVEPALVFGDDQAVREGMIKVGGVVGIDHIEVFDPAGRLVADWHRGHTGMPQWLAHRANAVIWPHPSVDRIERGGTAIGEVRVFGNSGGLVRYAISGAIIALCCLALTVIATRILARRLQQDVIEPLGAVGTVAHMVRSERAFGRRVPPSGIAEIDHFAQDFNALLSELEGWHAGLTSENAELARLATHDPLTGLGNRALFERMVGEAIGQAVRSGASFAVLFLDVDGFKAINDQHGHDAGDAALREVAERLRASVRHVDSAFRMGGDEFAVLLGPLFNRAHVDAVIERIELAMGQPLLIPGFGDASLGLSIGVALYPDDGVSPQDLLRRADAKMYKHKHDRRTNFEGGMNDA